MRSAHGVYCTCPLLLAVQPAAAVRTVRGVGRKTALQTRKARAATTTSPAAWQQGRRGSFFCKGNHFIFYCKVVVFFLFSIFRSGKIPKACGEVQDKRNVVPPRGRGAQAGTIKMHTPCREFYALRRPRVRKTGRRTTVRVLRMSCGRGQGATPITNSPQACGTPSLRGRTKENLTHFFGHYPIFPLFRLFLSKKRSSFPCSRSILTFLSSL